MRYRKGFVGEFPAVNRVPASSVASLEIPTLNHKVWNHPVKDGVRVSESLLPGGELFEIFHRFRGDFAKETYDDATGGFFADCDVEINLIRHLEHAEQRRGFLGCTRRRRRRGCVGLFIRARDPRRRRRRRRERCRGGCERETASG